MTGAYLFATRNGKRETVEVEFLTPEERKEKLGDRTPEELLNWLDITCKALQQCEEILTSLESDGIIQRAEEVSDEKA